MQKNSTPPAAQLGSLDTVMEGVSLLMQWQRIPRFREIVWCQIGASGETGKYVLEVSPRDYAYSLQNVETGEISSFDGRTRELVSDGDPVPYDLSMLIFEPMPTRLAFPMSLGIWGRDHDNFRIVGGESTGQLIVLELASRDSPEISGKLILDKTRSKAIGFVSPILKIWYEADEEILKSL